MWLSLAGAIICVAIMFVISWITALLTFAVVLALYLLVSYRKPDVNWGSTTQAQTYKNALSGVQHLNRITDHVKNYRPQILVLTGFPGERPILTDLTHLLTKGLSLMLCGHVLQGQVSHKAREALVNRANYWFMKRKLKAFYTVVDDVSFRDGVTSLIQASGLGKLRPNILLMGFKENWQSCARSDISDYVEIMHKALDVHLALAILRVNGGLHFTDALDDELQAFLRDINVKDLTDLSRSMGDNYKESKSTESLNIHSQGSSMSDVSIGSPQLRRVAHVSPDPSAISNSHSKQSIEKDRTRRTGMAGVRDAVGRAVGRARRASSFCSIEQFTRRLPGTVDVWWLYDDGGLTLLLPYILSTRRAWASCPLRVFTLANKQTELELEERNMAQLLSKFRIDYSALKMVADITKKPRASTLAYFDRIVARFKSTTEASTVGLDAACISEADLVAAADRTNRHLRLRELIAEHSSGARLVCVTLPMPRRRAVVPPPLYLAWLHAIATAADRVLFIRGNHSSVLTFYS